MQVDYEIAGVDSVLMRFGTQPDATLVAQIGAVSKEIRQQLSAVVCDVIPSYTTLLVIYDVRQTRIDALIAQLKNLVVAFASQATSSDSFSGQTVRLPICYEPAYAPDILALSKQLSLSPDEIIKLHSQNPYRVYAIGFSPGFGYMGHVDPQLRVTRLATPRIAVPAGSLAIAEAYSAVYPQETPGGWWLIGRCPLALFDKHRSPINLLSVGDEVVFEPISAETYVQLAGSRS